MRKVPTAPSTPLTASSATISTCRAKALTVRPNTCLRSVSPLLRYDFMTDHSDGSSSAVVTAADGMRTLKTTDYKRGRITGGVTLSLDRPFASDIRVNYEKYFYGHDGIPKVSEKR